MNAPCVHIFLPVHNRRATTEKFISCLLAQTWRNWHLILIDDGSTDGTEEMVRARVPRLTVLKGQGNWWWGGSLHKGFQWMQHARLPNDDVVLINNDDTFIGGDFLALGLQLLRPRSLLVAQQYYLSGEFCEAGVKWDWRNFDWAAVSDPREINCFPTRGLFVHVEDFLEVGGFHPILLPHYLSDYEFTQRAHRKGYLLLSDPALFLRYDEKLTGIRTRGEPTLWRRMRAPFSVRSTDNPIYWSSFVLLASPLLYMPLNFAKVWWRYFIPISHPITVRLSILGRKLRKLWALITDKSTHHAL